MRNLLLALLVSTTACAARAQLSPTECQHAMSLFVSGKSMDQITAELGLESRDQARELVHDAMISTTRRFWREQH